MHYKFKKCKKEICNWSKIVWHLGLPCALTSDAIHILLFQKRMTWKTTVVIFACNGILPLQPTKDMQASAIQLCISYTSISDFSLELLIVIAHNMEALNITDFPVYIPVRCRGLCRTFIGSFPLKRYRWSCDGLATLSRIPSHIGDIHCPISGS
jgi:hypothetical protein